MRDEKGGRINARTKKGMVTSERQSNSSHEKSHIEWFVLRHSIVTVNNLDNPKAFMLLHNLH